MPFQFALYCLILPLSPWKRVFQWGYERFLRI